MWKMVIDVEDRDRASVASIANQIEQGELENLGRRRLFLGWAFRTAFDGFSGQCFAVIAGG